MEELSAQFREVKVAHDELVGRKASLAGALAVSQPPRWCDHPVPKAVLEFPPLRCKLGQGPLNCAPVLRY